METNLMIIPFLLVLIHFIADFIFQDEKWALGKSKNLKDLLYHTVTYSLIWVLPIFFIFYTFCNNVEITEVIDDTVLFVIITFICHTITDYFTSKIVSKKFSNQEYGSTIPNIGAFTYIGFDQVLHYGQLFFTYQLLS